MSRRPLAGQSGLVYLLLLVASAELALNRLAVPTLQPRSEAPPVWHEVLSYVGLFLLYFASTLAVGVVAGKLTRLLQGPARPSGWRLVPGVMLVTTGLGFLGLAIINLTRDPGEDLTFAFDTAFTLLLILWAVHVLITPGDLWSRIGVAVLALPLVLHYYAPFRLMFLDGPEARWGDLPLEMQDWGKWAAVVAAILSPYLFCPKPIESAVVRPAPLAVAAFIGVVGAVILRQHYEVGMELATRGMGIEIRAGEPASHIAFYVVALASLSWALVACISAPSPARRDIGVGLGLVVVGGYGFDWPLQYLASAAGLFTIGRAAVDVQAEERRATPAPAPRGFRQPPVSGEIWQRWATALVDALRAGDPSSRPSTVTVGGDGPVQTTHVVLSRRGVPVQLRVHRANDAVLCIDVVCGRAPPAGQEPSWTLYARPERLLGAPPHEEPPACTAPVVRTADATFDARFRLRDRGGLTEKLVDEPLRARSAALLDGWMALWPKHSLEYRVNPGRGAPLDSPIAITQLSFRGAEELPPMERPLALIDLLAAIAERAGLADTAEQPEVLGDSSS